MKEWTTDSEYIRGKRDIMLEMAKEDLIDVASRIAETNRGKMGTSRAVIRSRLSADHY